MRTLASEYFSSLNSADLFDPELPLLKSKANGGTMVLWRHKHDPFITVIPVPSTAFLPVIFHPPELVPSIHIAVYLPTMGKEMLFIDELSKLSIAIEDMSAAHPGAPLYLRGDFNVSHTNPKRSTLLKHFCSNHNLHDLHIPHKSYHHFVGNGQSDSNLDRILFSKSQGHEEALLEIICKQTEPLINSHHDLLISSWCLPTIAKAEPDSSQNIVAPKLDNNRAKVLWTDEGIEQYQNLVSPHFTRLQNLWLKNPTLTSVSLLLQSTNKILTQCAEATNKTIPLSGPKMAKKFSTPKPVRVSQNALKKMNKHLRKVTEGHTTGMADVVKLKNNYNTARLAHRKLERQYKAKDSYVRDQNLSKGPSFVYKSIKASKRSRVRKIQKLTVGKKTYLGETVKDGFFDSISGLKTRDANHLDSCATFQEFSQDFQNILEVCRHGAPIPSISEKKCLELLQKMKPDVTDIYGVTVNHYNYAGPPGWNHFHLMLNCLISDVNNINVEEINTVYACILFKGHNKERSSDRSYRTISSCPVVAKALDVYVKDLNIESWNHDQSDVQFQGEGSSHELAAVLLTETIQHSLHTLKVPLYALYLDAESAFDVVLQELLVRRLFHTNTRGHSLLYLNNRLGSRKTIIDWDGQLMGPVHDERGLEQGGVSSSDFYKIFGKEQLTLAQSSKLGVHFENSIISAVGQADDTVLVSNSLHHLQYLLLLSEAFCSRNQVKLSATKTKLQVFYTKCMASEVRYAMITNPIKLDNVNIQFTVTAEHVGILRSTAGNATTIFTRITEHNKAMRAVMHTGMARSHRGNPAASLVVSNLYGLPVLLSGLAPLVMTKSEESIIEQHHKENISNLQRLLPCTPTPVVCFLAGSLPGSAHLHLRKLTIFGMICRLLGNSLHDYAVSLFQAGKPPTKSWFHQILELCEKYCLPSPMQLLESPLPKIQFKKLVKGKVVNFWENYLRAQAAPLTSLLYFKPLYMSLTTTHPIWSSAGSSPAKVTMASVQARMLSGRYRTEALCSNWKINCTGLCLLSQSCSSSVEDLEHILSHCTALDPTRTKLMDFTIHYCRDVPDLSNLILSFINVTNKHFCQFLLDCSTLPEVVNAAQLLGANYVHQHLFNITRTWIYSIHKERLKLLGRWNNLL